MVVAAQHEIGLAGCCHCSSGRDARRGWQRREGLTWARSCWVSSRCGVPGWMWAALGLWVWKFLKVAGGIGLFKGQVVWFFLFAVSMDQILWVLICGVWKLFLGGLNGCGDFLPDLWRLFLGFWFVEIVCRCGVDVDHVQFVFLQKSQGREKQRVLWFWILFIYLFLYVFNGENDYVGNRS